MYVLLCWGHSCTVAACNAFTFSISFCKLLVNIYSVYATVCTVETDPFSLFFFLSIATLYFRATIATKKPLFVLTAYSTIHLFYSININLIKKIMFKLLFFTLYHMVKLLELHFNKLFVYFKVELLV